MNHLQPESRTERFETSALLESSCQSHFKASAKPRGVLILIGVEGSCLSKPQQACDPQKVDNTKLGVPRNTNETQVPRFLTTNALFLHNKNTRVLKTRKRKALQRSNDNTFPTDCPHCRTEQTRAQHSGRHPQGLHKTRAHSGHKNQRRVCKTATAILTGCLRPREIFCFFDANWYSNVR